MPDSPLDPGIAAYYERLTAELGPLPSNPTPAQRWARIEEIGRREPRPYPAGLEVSDHYLALPGREIAVRLYRPVSSAPLALLVYLHGGGWVIGSIASHDRMVAELASGSGVAFASAHYRRAPETPSPDRATMRRPRCMRWPSSRAPGLVHGFARLTAHSQAAAQAVAATAQVLRAALA